MIPKTIHQIWLGDKKAPKEWMETWQKMNPNFVIHIWDYDGLKLFKLKNDRVFEDFMSTKEYCGAADVARAELVERIGGIYIDADCICIKTLEDAPFMQSDFFAVYDHEVPGHPGRINNGVIGAVPKHQILKDYIKKIGEATEIRPPWKTIGGKLLTECINKQINQIAYISILPAYTFWPENHNGLRTRIEGECYSQHFWGTSKNLYK